MLRTNLSTRPFYNARAVRTVLAGLASIVAVATLFNVVQLVRLSTRHSALSANAVKNEDEAKLLTREAQQVRARIDPAELTQVSAAAGEANAIIDRRAFSWTTLFSRFESALPGDVRITAVQPRREQDGTFGLSIAVEARRIENVDAFIEALESLGTFKNVLPSEEQTNDDGVIEAVLDGQYIPDGVPASGNDVGTASPAPSGAPASAAATAGRVTHE